MRVAFRKKGSTIYAKLIRLWTFGKYSHSELVFSDGRSFSSDEADGGTRWKDWAMSDEEWDFLNVPCTFEQEQEIRAFCAGEEHCKYDMVGIGFSFLPIPIGVQSAEKWFCSEICVAGLQQIGYLVGYTPSRISPNALHKILSKELGRIPKVVQAAALCLCLVLAGCASTTTTITALGDVYCTSSVDKPVAITPSLQADGNDVKLPVLP